MRKSFFALIVVGFVLLSMGISSVYAGEEKYKSPWVETDLNLNKLIKEGYKIVGTSVFSGFNSFIECIYLQKKDKLYKCFTKEMKGGSEHGCNFLAEPKKSN